MISGRKTSGTRLSGPSPGIIDTAARSRSLTSMFQEWGMISLGNYITPNAGWRRLPSQRYLRVGELIWSEYRVFQSERHKTTRRSLKIFSSRIDQGNSIQDRGAVRWWKEGTNIISRSSDRSAQEVWVWRQLPTIFFIKVHLCVGASFSCCIIKTRVIMHRFEWYVCRGLFLPENWNWGNFRIKYLMQQICRVFLPDHGAAHHF